MSFDGTIWPTTIVSDILPTAKSERRGCRWLGVHRSAVRYEPDHRDVAALRSTLRELAEANPRWGAPMLLWKLRREGVVDNHKRLRGSIGSKDSRCAAVGESV